MTDRDGKTIGEGFKVIVDLGPRNARTGKVLKLRARTLVVSLDGDAKRPSITRRPWQVKVI